MSSCRYSNIEGTHLQKAGQASTLTACPSTRIFCACVKASLAELIDLNVNDMEPGFGPWIAPKIHICPPPKPRNLDETTKYLLFGCPAELNSERIATSQHIYYLKKIRQLISGLGTLTLQRRTSECVLHPPGCLKPVTANVRLSSSGSSSMCDGVFFVLPVVPTSTNSGTVDVLSAAVSVVVEESIVVLLSFTSPLTAGGSLGSWKDDFLTYYFQNNSLLVKQQHATYCTLSQWTAVNFTLTSVGVLLY